MHVRLFKVHFNLISSWNVAVAQRASAGVILRGNGTALSLRVVVKLCHPYSFLASWALMKLLLRLTLFQPVFCQTRYLLHL